VAAPHSTFSQALSTSLYNYVSRGKFADNVFDGLRTLQVIRDMGGRAEAGGGESIVVQLEYAENATAEWIGPYGTYNLNPQDILTSAQFRCKQIAGSVILTDEEQVQNSGNTRLANLIEIKIKNLQKSLRTRMNEALFSDGTDPLKPVGLEAVVLTTGTYGGISRTANTWWRANVESTAEVLNVPRMVTMYNDASHNLDFPKLIVTTQALYEKYEALAQAYQEIQHPGSGGVADLGFEHLRFKGRPLIWDDDVPSGTMFFLNPDYFKMYVHPDWEFRPMPVQRPANQPLEVHVVSWFGAFACSNCRMLGALRGKTA
jgi:hypothetical protein